MSDGEWKEKLIKEKLGGKKEWTEEERNQLCRQLDRDLENHIDNLTSGENKYKDGWTEQNWKEQMSEHPLFAPYVQEEGVSEGVAPINPLSEGLAQLKFDPEHNTPQEVAQNYKEEGIHQFKYKKYRLAVANFSEGIKQKCTDGELNAQLYNNRAAANLHLGNYRSALKDCEKAFELKPDYTKAVLRAVDCASELKLWDDVFVWCDRGLKLDPGELRLKKTRLTAVKEKKLQERDQRKKTQEEKKKENEEQTLLNTIQSRGVNLGKAGTITLSHLEPCHPAAQGSRVHINECGELVWPVMLIYPEYQETDFIQHFSENDRIIDQLEAVFGEDVPPAPWDRQHRYRLGNLRVFFEDRQSAELCSVDLHDTLAHTLSHPRYQVQGGTPGLIILVEGKFMTNFMNKYTG